MAAGLVIAPEAEQDINEAYGWYEPRRIGLGEEFLTWVDACIQAICRTPEMHARIHENYRRGLVRRFPYAVFSNLRMGWSPFTAFSTRHRILTNGAFALPDSSS